MEPVPDMDTLLDEVENSTDLAGIAIRSGHERRNTNNFVTFQAPQILNTITNSPATRFIESGLGPHISESEHSKEVRKENESKEEPTNERVSPLPSGRSKEEPHNVNERKSSCEEVAKQVIQVNPHMEMPSSEVEMTNPDLDFDAALERYLEQFHNEDEYVEVAVIHKEVEVKETEQRVDMELTTMIEETAIMMKHHDLNEEFKNQTEELLVAAKTVACDIVSNVINEITQLPNFTPKHQPIDATDYYNNVEECSEVQEGEAKPPLGNSEDNTSEPQEEVSIVIKEPEETAIEEETRPSCDSKAEVTPSTEEPSEIEILEYMADSVLDAQVDLSTAKEVSEKETDDGEKIVVDEDIDTEQDGHCSTVDITEEGRSEPENSIATFHHLEQETSSSRLTESELLLGKQKPYWIPDSDCESCMLCSTRFSLINRRHHCRACGRVLCSACCSAKVILDYMKTEEESKKLVATRVCEPCFTTLVKIEEYEKERAQRESEQSTTRVKGVLKSRTETESELEPSTSEQPVHPKRSVTFRDGVNPGAAPGPSTNPEKSTVIKPKKKSRKRSAVVRRVTELKLEDELTCYLPATESQSFIVKNIEGDYECQTVDQTTGKLRDGVSQSIVVRKNIICVVQAANVYGTEVYSVASKGFSSVGLDELLFVWKRKDGEISMAEVVVVLERISQIFRSALDGDTSGVQQVVSRFPRVQSSLHTAYPLPKHIYLYRPTFQNFGPLHTPTSSFLVASFLADSELSWILACPNRVLFRLGLKYGVYPCPVVNIPEREAVFSMETVNTVLKVFTDFRSWSYRMVSIPGSTLTLTNDVTILKIPRDSQAQIKSIMSWNKSMLAWCCDVNSTADSHLVCEENDGMYSSHVFSKGSTRSATGASFVILDGGLKTNSQLQVSVFEDGVAVRVQAEQFRAICEAFQEFEPRDLAVKDSNGTQLTIEWIEIDENAGEYDVRSPIDGMYLEDKFQYGLSLERAITAVLEVQTVPGLGVRLSHVYNLHKGRLSPEDEPKVFSIVEMLSRECTALLGPYLSMLLSMEINSVSIRFYAFQDSVEYDVSSWLGLEQENVKYRESMDQLIPALCNVAEYVSNGIHLEFTLTFITTMILPTTE